MSLSELFFSAEGRIGRRVFVVGAAVLIAAGAILPPLAPALAPVVWLVSFYGWICLFAKRLHDLGRSAWLQTAPFLVGWTLMSLGAAAGLASLTGLARSATLGPLALGGAAASLGMTTGLFLLGGGVHLLLSLWLGLAPGDTGLNRYGPAPGRSLVEGGARV